MRTTLGPRAMLKMLLDANGGIVLTNDGNAILREIDVSHPAAKVQQRSREGSCGRAATAASSWPLVSRAPGRHASRACAALGRLCCAIASRGNSPPAGCSNSAGLRICLPQSIIELSRTQDEEVGDGTTSVIILGERPGEVNSVFDSG